jgi:hypothetical protein
MAYASCCTGDSLGYPKLDYNLRFCGIVHLQQYLERRMVCNFVSLSVKAFVALATQEHLEYRCKALFKTLCISNFVRYLNYKCCYKISV